MNGLSLQLSENSVGERSEKRAIAFEAGMLVVYGVSEANVQRKGRWRTSEKTLSQRTRASLEDQEVSHMDGAYAR